MGIEVIDRLARPEAFCPQLAPAKRPLLLSGGAHGCYTLPFVINRRDFALAASAFALGGGGAGAQDKPSSQYIELRWYMLRNGHADQFQRTSDYVQAIEPILRDAGAKATGAFASVIGPETPFLITLTAWADIAALEAGARRVQVDKTADAALRAMHGGQGAPFERCETWLLRAFEGFPTVQPAADPKRGRIFELRRYESDDFVTLARKVDMFNNGESAIFQRLGMAPVFFGHMLYGPKMPNLVYMLSFDDLAERDRLWRAFGSDAEWKKLSSKPELQDSEVVSNISNWIIRPLLFSAIR